MDSAFVSTEAFFSWTPARAILAETTDVAPTTDAKEIVFRLRQSANDLMDLDKHYQRKEHTLFSCLERHGITGPSKVMWSKDDEVRNLLKQMNQAAHDWGATVADVTSFFAQCAQSALPAVEEMIFEEENILFPMSLQTLTQSEWAEVWSASPQYGWCLVEPQKGYLPPGAVGAATGTAPKEGTIMMPTGHVSVANNVRRHRLISISYTSLLPCYGTGRRDRAVLASFPHLELWCGTMCSFLFRLRCERIRSRASELSCSRFSRLHRAEHASYFRAGSKEETREAVQEAQVEVLLV